MSDSVDGADSATAGTESAPTGNLSSESSALQMAKDELARLYSACAESSLSGSGKSATIVEAVRLAREEAEELGGNPPDALSATLLEILAHSARAKSAVYIGEAPGVVALALLSGMTAGATVTAITSDPHHAHAGKRAIAAAQYPSNACRFISTRPSEVLGKLATGSYDLVVAQHGSLSEQTLATRGLELAGAGSVLVLGSASAFAQRSPLPGASSSLDDDAVELPESARVQRLPLGSGITLLYNDL